MNTGLCGGAQDVEGADDVRRERVLGVLHRAHDGGLCREVIHDACALKSGFDRRRVPNVTLDEPEPALEAMLLEIRTPAPGEVVERNDVCDLSRKQPIDEMAADEAGSASDDELLGSWHGGIVAVSKTGVR